MCVCGCFILFRSLRQMLKSWYTPRTTTPPTHPLPSPSLTPSVTLFFSLVVVGLSVWASTLCVRACVCVCVCARARARGHVCVCADARTGFRVGLYRPVQAVIYTQSFPDSLICLIIRTDRIGLNLGRSVHYLEYAATVCNRDCTWAVWCSQTRLLPERLG